MLERKEYNKNYQEKNKEVLRIRAQRYRELNRERIREYQKTWRKNHRNICRKASKKWADSMREEVKNYNDKYKKNNPHKINAYSLVIRSIKKGTLKKPKHCLDCKTGSEKLEAHHPDYRKPLDVVWLCRPCHSKLHWSLKLKNYRAGDVRSSCEAGARRTDPALFYFWRCG